MIIKKFQVTGNDISKLLKMDNIFGGYYIYISKNILVMATGQVVNPFGMNMSTIIVEIKNEKRAHLEIVSDNGSIGPFGVNKIFEKANSKSIYKDIDKYCFTHGFKIKDIIENN
jgi:hypothetical protein